MSKKHFTSILNEPNEAPAIPAVNRAAAPKPVSSQPTERRNPNIRKQGRPRLIKPGLHTIVVPLEQSNSDILTQMVALQLEGARSIREATNAAFAFYGAQHPELFRPLSSEK